MSELLNDTFAMSYLSRREVAGDEDRHKDGKSNSILVLSPRQFNQLVRRPKRSGQRQVLGPIWYRLTHKARCVRRKRDSKKVVSGSVSIIQQLSAARSLIRHGSFAM